MNPSQSQPEPPSPVALDEATVGDGMVAVLRGLGTELGSRIAAVRADTDPTAIHQARVATRRFRSALSSFRPINPALAPLGAEVRHCAATLGAVREWDVFLADVGGTLAALDDPRAGALLRAAARRREMAAATLAAYLAGEAFGALERTLAEDALWRGTEPLDAPFRGFAAGILSHRLKRVRRRGRSLDELPMEALHELRKDCKRLRYAAELFAPAFPDQSAKRLLRRMAEVQADLGTLNDAVVCAELVRQLGRSGRGYAGGLTAGLALAAARPARERVNRSWKRFHKVRPFWK